MPHPAVFFEIIGPDAAKLPQFYAGLFGWNVDANNPFNYGMVQNGEGIDGGIGVTPDGSSRVTFYVQADDLQAMLDKAVSMGGKVVMPVMEIPGTTTTIAQFSDPAGNTIGLTKG